MGIRLDWEIEAEREKLRTSGEDPESLRARRRGQARFLLFVGAVLLIFAAIVGGVVLRLRQVDWENEQLLRDTVDAEVASLRLGDRTAYLAFQRSATDEWTRRQETLFQHYQLLKQTVNVNLTGQILDVTIDGSRARVRLEEIIDGVPYARVWFYWRYQPTTSDSSGARGGWRHVPPDYTFWGQPGSIESERLVVVYRSFDEEVAQAVSARVNEWLAAACAALPCDSLPRLTVEIVPDEALQTGWLEGDPWRLLIPSPYTGDARIDMLFDAAAQRTVAGLLAARLVAHVTSSLQPLPGSDAAFLRGAVVTWLNDRFAGIETSAFLVDSLARNAGEGAVGRLAQALQRDSMAAVLNVVAGTPSLDQANLDWRDYLTWRLRLENERIAARDEAGLLALYDSADETARNFALQRYNSLPGERSVVSFLLQPGTPPTLRALAQITETGETEEILFRLVDGEWKRAS